MSNRLENRMRGYPSFNELRNKQINEVIDYDRNISRRVLLLEKEAVKVFGDVYKPPTEIEKNVAFNIDKYIAGIKSELTAQIEDIDKSTLTPGEKYEITEGKAIRYWDEMVSYIQNYAATNQLPERDYNKLYDKLDTQLMPLLDYIDENGKIVLENGDSFIGLPLYQQMKNKIEFRDLTPIKYQRVEEAFKFERPFKGRGKYGLYYDTPKPVFNYDDEKDDTYLK